MNDMAMRDRARRRQDMRRRRNYDRAMREEMEMEDGRNPWGSRGGYVTRRRPRRGDRAMQDMRGGYGRGRDYAGDYEQGSRSGDMAYSRRDYAGDYGDYERDGNYGGDGVPFSVYGNLEMQDFARRRNSRGRFMRDYGNDYGDYGYDYGYDYASGTKMDEEELYEWYEKLCKEIPEQYKHLFKKENIKQIAEQMRIEFNKFTPMELTVTATMLASDYQESLTPSDIQKYVAMAKQFLEDKDAKVKGGEKLSAYYDAIVMGE